MDKHVNLKDEVLKHFKKMQTVYYATYDGTMPRVRPMALIYHNNRFWISTGTKNAKVKQIQENKNSEFCLLVREGENNGSVRCSGESVIIDDKATKKELADTMPFFKEFWKDVDDPNYTLIEIRVKNIEYSRPGTYEIERFALA